MFERLYFCISLTKLLFVVDIVVGVVVTKEIVIRFCQQIFDFVDWKTIQEHIHYQHICYKTCQMRA